MKISLLNMFQFVAIFQLVIFSFFLLARKVKKQAGIFLGIHLISQAIGIAGSLVVYNDYFYSDYIHLYFIGYPAIFLWGPTFYFYVKAFTFSDFKLRWHHLLHLIPASLIFVYLSSSFYFYGEETKRRLLGSLIFVQNSELFNLFQYLQILIYSFLCLSILNKYNKRLKENFSSVSEINLSWLKLIIISFLAAFFIASITHFITIYYKFDTYYLHLSVFIIYLIFFNMIFIKSWHHQEIFAGIEEKKKYKTSHLIKTEAEQWIEKIDNYMQVHKPYLIPGITIDDLAEKINIQARILSQIVNEYYKQSFYDFISKYRIEEAKKILSTPGNKKTVLEIVYDTGYNSKTAFNKAFKKFIGLTPTEYKKTFVQSPVSTEQD